jgi:FKBP-type peptidyl-prolyl cis-trans isomerase
MPRKNMYIAVALAVVVIAAFLFLGFFGIGGTPMTQPETSVSPAQQLLNEIAKNGSVSTLQVVDTVEGTGEAAQPGDQIAVFYTGVLPDGTIFDSTDNHGGQAFNFKLGVGSVIKGWDQGLVGMKVGGTRLIAIPADLGYGAAGNGAIPPNATLIFQVQLLSVSHATSTSAQ